MTPHIEASSGDYAETILLPGDPLRAKWIAETFLDDVKCVNRVRNCLGFTGSYKGVPISTQATGMGQPSTAIYVHELLNMFGAKTLVRVGTCGGLNTDVKLRDVIIAMTACTDSGMNRAHFAPFDFAPSADFGLVRKAVEIAEEKSIRHHVGPIFSSDVFYSPDGIATYQTLMDHGILGVEMETSTIFTLAARFGARALSICSMSDCIITETQISADERQQTLTQMIELALETVVADAS
ncbi:MAG: purine-nucleoside phosphorylase [Pseudomonadota bacterium]